MQGRLHPRLRSVALGALLAVSVMTATSASSGESSLLTADPFAPPGPSQMTLAKTVLIHLCGEANSPRTCLYKCVESDGTRGYCLWLCPPQTKKKCHNGGWDGTLKQMGAGPWLYYY
jgi:hypothetical protein